MKILKIFLICLTLTQCDKNNRKNVSEEILLKTSINQIDTTSNDNKFIEDIKQYYLKGDAEKLRLVESDTDSLKTLEFSDEMNIVQMRIEIPKMTKNLTIKEKIIFSDINNDGLKDALVCVYREGGWQAGNVFDTDIFVLKKDKTKFTIKSVNNSRNLTKCDFGQFQIKGFQNGKIFGNSFCYAPNDGHCCPSLKYNTKLKIENWELKHLSSEEIEQ